MGGNLVGDDAVAHIFAVGETQVFFGRDVAYHGRSQPGDLSRADGRCDVVIAGGDVGGQRAEGVERGFVARGELAFHVFPYLLHGNVTGAFDDDLHVVGPCLLGELTQHVEFEELRTVVGVVYRARAHAVAQREGHIVLLDNLAYLVEVGVEEILFVVAHAPFGHDGTSARHDTRETLAHQFGMSFQHASMNGEVVDALFTLFDEGVAVDFPSKVFGHAVHFFEGLVDGYRTHGHGAVADNPLAGFVYVVACREVHERVASPIAAPHGFLHLFFDARREGRVSDVGVEFHQEVAADNHRFGFGVVDVGRNDGAAASHFVTHELGGDVGIDAQHLVLEVLAYRHIFHLGRDDALFGIVHLGDFPSGLGAVGQVQVFEADFIEALVSLSHAAVF